MSQQQQQQPSQTNKALSLAQYAKSVEHQKRVIDLRTQLSAAEDTSLADSLHQYAAALWWNGQYDDAAPIYERSLAIRRRLLGLEHLDVAMSLTHLGACRVKQDRIEEATGLYRRRSTCAGSCSATGTRTSRRR